MLRYALIAILWTVGLVSVGASLVPAEEPKPTVPAASKEPLDPEHAKKAAESLALFKEHVKPILVKHCLDCHGGKAIKADFDLSTREKLLNSGAVEKTAETSHLYQLVPKSRGCRSSCRNFRTSRSAI